MKKEHQVYMIEFVSNIFDHRLQRLLQLKSQKAPNGVSHAVEL